MLALYFLDFSVGVEAFVIGLIQMFSFSLTIVPTMVPDEVALSDSERVMYSIKVATHTCILLHYGHL